MIKSFEELTEERIGFGKYQYIVISLLGLIFVADGIEMSAMSLIFPILKIEWNISENLQALIGSALFVGFFLGSLIAGILTDKLGRKQTLEYASLVQFFIGIYSTFINNPYIFLLVRGLFGFLLGYIVPIVPTLCAELIPMDKRGKITVIINGLFSVGQFLATIFAWMCLSSLSSGNWRAMLFICSLPPLLVWYGSYKYLKESPCFVIMKGNLDEGINLLNQIGTINKGNNFKFYKEKDYKLFQEWKMNIDALHDNQSSENEIKNNLKTMLSDKNSFRRITLSMWASWFGINFVLYGLVFILPFFLNEIDNTQKTKGGLESLILTTFGEGLSGVIAYFLVDTHMFGRKYSLALGQFFSSLCCLIACFISTEYSLFLVIFLSLGRLFAKMCFSIIYPLTAEIYPTKFRTMGVGIASAIGRIAGCIMPFVAIKLFYHNIYSPFFSFFIMGVAGLIGTLMLPYDTRGRYLDIQTDSFKELSTQLKSDFRKI
jgi:MFS family permease